MSQMIFVVDDEIAIANMVQTVVKNLGFQSKAFYDSQYACKEITKQQPFLVISDLSMPKLSGLELLKKVKETNSAIQFIIMTGYATIESAVDCISEGAVNYIQKPLNIDHLRHLVNQSVEKMSLIQENKSLRKRLHSQNALSEIIGRSPPMEKIRQVIRKVAPSNANILITGESGTGKELIAKAIHNHSNRKANNLISIDCVALPANLFESELFGYEKGAFTGAEQKKKGLMELANRGTFFMDEITELNYNLQAKLLRVLQERQFRRVGGRTVIDVDMRVISATRRDPQQAVNDKLFREDLYYRLNVIPIRLPPLRDRPEDIPSLIQHFLTLESQTIDNETCTVDAEAMEYLINYKWPGNIRELRNITTRMSILCKENHITVNDLPTTIREQQKVKDSELLWAIKLPFKDAKDMVLERFEKEYLRQHLELSNGNIARAALESGVNRKTYHRLINKYQLSVHNR